MLALLLASQLVTLAPTGVRASVQVHYQSTYLTQDQFYSIPPQILGQIDTRTGQTVTELLNGAGNGIPSLSHTWITARRELSYTWNRQPQTHAEAATVSWLPDHELISPEAAYQQGRNYDDGQTDGFLAGAAAGSVAELAIIAEHVRTDGPAVGWQTAADMHPIINRPLLGIIPRRIAANQIEQQVGQMAAQMDFLAYNPRLAVQRGDMAPIAISEDAFFAVKARGRQLASTWYSMFTGVSRLTLASVGGATNCHSAAADLLTGGESAYGTVPLLDFGLSRGYNAASAVHWFYSTYAPTYALPAAAKAKYAVGDDAVAPRLGKPEGGACSCETAGASCKLSLGDAGSYTVGTACASTCAPGGSALPLLLAHCATVTID